MAINYEIVDADIFDIKANFANNKIAFLAKDSKQTIYIFKPSWTNHFHNINEYIAHHIGSLIGAPMLKGMFLKINVNNMKKWHKVVSDLEGTQIYPTFIPPYEHAVFFAVEYKQNKFSAHNIPFLQHILSKISNKDDFFSQFSFDQYLKNPDRHLGNHIFYKDSHRLLFYLIDFDRIFSGKTDWSGLDTDYTDFSCFCHPGYNQDLYFLVNNENMKMVHNYAGYIEKISDEDIQDIIQTISQVYDIQKPLLVKIADWLNDRKERIFDKCLENESCYPNVNKRGLLSAGR